MDHLQCVHPLPCCWSLRCFRFSVSGPKEYTCCEQRPAGLLREALFRPSSQYSEVPHSHSRRSVTETVATPLGCTRARASPPAARRPPRDARSFAFRRSRQVRGASLRTSLASLLTDTRHVKSSVGSVCWEDVVPRLWLLACLFIFKWYFSKGKNVSILLKSVCLFFFFSILCFLCSR